MKKKRVNNIFCITFAPAVSLAGRPPPIMQWNFSSSTSPVIKGVIATVFIYTGCLIVLRHLKVSGSQNLHPSLPVVASNE